MFIFFKAANLHVYDSIPIQPFFFLFYMQHSSMVVFQIILRQTRQQLQGLPGIRAEL